VFVLAFLHITILSVGGLAYIYFEVGRSNNSRRRRSGASSSANIFIFIISYRPRSDKFYYLPGGISCRYPVGFPVRFFGVSGKVS
jgi:hypothetical protein